GATQPGTGRCMLPGRAALPAATRASSRARWIRPWISGSAWKRTSILEGWTLTSTSAGSISRKRRTTAWRPGGGGGRWGWRAGAVGVVDGAVDERGADGAPVDEEEMVLPRAAREGRQAAETAHAQALAADRSHAHQVASDGAAQEGDHGVEWIVAPGRAQRFL